MVVREWLRKLEPSLYCNGIFKLKANTGITINVLRGIYFKITIILCHKLPTFNLELNCWLRKLEPTPYRDGIFKLKVNTGIIINVIGEYMFKIKIILCHKLPAFNLELNSRLILTTCRRVATEHF